MEKESHTTPADRKKLEKHTHFEYVDLDEGKTLDEIHADRLAAQAIHFAESRRSYEEKRDEEVRIAKDRHERGLPVFNSYIVSAPPGRAMTGVHTRSQSERNRVEIREVGIANANHPQDDASLRY